MKLSKTELNKIAEFRRKVEEAKVRDIIKLLEELGYDIADTDNLKQELKAGKDTTTRDTVKLLLEIGYDLANTNNLKQQLEAGKDANPSLFITTNEEKEAG